MEDFSDSEDSENETSLLLPVTQAGDAEHENGQVVGTADVEWRRDEARTASMSASSTAQLPRLGPSLLTYLTGRKHTSLFKLGCRLLPVKYLQALAESMDAVTRALWMDTIWSIAQGQCHSLTLAAARQIRQGRRTRLQTGSAGLVCGLSVLRAKVGIYTFLGNPT
eukprot:5493389-Pleurochrysis_carterae.AAC.2